jgi:hypothetical protein
MDLHEVEASSSVLHINYINEYKISFTFRQSFSFRCIIVFILQGSLNENHHGKATIVFISFKIFTLSLIINQAEKYEIKPVITFDQSLY